MSVTNLPDIPSQGDVNLTVRDLVTNLPYLQTDVTGGSNIIVTANGTKGIIINTGNVLSDNARAHNSIYRGISLGTSVTTTQYTNISNGTFADMYIGDYWTINSIVWRIAGFNYWYNVGDTNFTTNHVVIVPDTNLGANQVMEATNITTNGYALSAMRGDGTTTGNITTARDMCTSAFSGHIATHRLLLCNAATSGTPTGWTWYDSYVDLMNEVMVYGARAWGAFAGNSYNVASQDGQLPLFNLAHDLIHTRQNYWLQDVVNSTNFADVYYAGRASGTNSSNTSVGVRPAFSIIS